MDVLDALLSPLLPAFIITAILAFALLTRCTKNDQGPPTSSSIVTDIVTERKTPYTLEQVAAHSTNEDLWLIINNKVYDFTEYYEMHPGGESILRNAGKDSTQGFSGSQHPNRVWDMVSLCSLI